MAAISLAWFISQIEIVLQPGVLDAAEMLYQVVAMHPLEHVLYFSRWIILFLVPSHPIHLLYLMQRAGLNPAVGHTGFDEVVINKERGIHRRLLFAATLSTSSPSQ